MIVKKEIYIIISLLIILFIVNYPFLDSKFEEFLEEENVVHVDRIIDGDTIVAGNETIRLLGVNTPERGEFYYEEAKYFLENEILNKSVKLEFVGERQDKYYRTLAYVFLEGENINVKIVENGFGNYYFYSGRDKYSEELEKAWEDCLENEIHLCEPSEMECAFCIKIQSEHIINNCGFDCNISSWEIKGEGRDKFIFDRNLAQSETSEFEVDLENSGGSLFLRDDKGRLVDFLM